MVLTRGRVLLAAVVAICVFAGPAEMAAAATWDQAVREIAAPAGADPEFPFTHLRAISCAGSGSCSAIGSYEEPELVSQAMVVSKDNGVWGGATRLPLPGDLDHPYLPAISCSSPGNCAAAGQVDISSDSMGLVASEESGTWQVAEAIPGPAGSQWTWLNSVSCSADGDCTAAGGYEDAGGQSHPLIVTAVDGHWGAPQPLAMPSGIGPSTEVALTKISCPTADSCAVVGAAWTGSGREEAVAARQAGGTWSGTKIISAPVGASPFAASDLSCGAAGTCVASGTYGTGGGVEHPAVAELNGGSWGPAVALPLPAEASGSTHANLSSVSCTAAGFCTAVGNYFTDTGLDKAFAAVQQASQWETAVEIPTPRTDEVSPYHLIGLRFVDCVAPGTCGAVGFSFWRGVDVLSQGGQWGPAEWIVLPDDSQSQEAGVIEGLSCGAPGSCSAVGEYTDAEGMGRAFALDTVAGPAADAPSGQGQSGQPPSGSSAGQSPPGSQSPPPGSAKPPKGARSKRHDDSRCPRNSKRKLVHGKHRCVRIHKKGGH